MKLIDFVSEDEVVGVQTLNFVGVEFDGDLVIVMEIEVGVMSLLFCDLPYLIDKL